MARHYTLAHSSGLNIAEIKIGILDKLCLNFCVINRLLY